LAPCWYVPCYVAVAVVLTGLVPWGSLIDDPAPVVNSLKKLGTATGSPTVHWTRLAVLFGAMMGMISSLLVFQLGQARVCASEISHTGDSDVNRRLRGGHPAGHFDVGTLADLSNIGTLFAFALVSAGVIILRFREQPVFAQPPGKHRPCRTDRFGCRPSAKSSWSPAACRRASAKASSSGSLIP